MNAGGEVLVTGATGYLGQRVVARLVAQGVPVRALVRREDERATRLREAGARLFVGDLRRPESLRPAVEGVWAVVHAAGAGLLGRGGNTPQAVDQRGTSALVDLAVQANVAHFVLISLIGANFVEGSAYFLAKRRAEQYLRSSGLRHTILRPGGLMADWTTAWERYGRRGFYLALGSPDRRLALVSPDDVAELAVRALWTPGPTSRTYDVTNGERLTARDVAALYTAFFGRPVQVRTVPVWPLKAGGLILHPFAPNVAELLRFLAALGQHEFEGEPERVEADFSVRLVTYREYLEQTCPTTHRVARPA